MHKDPDRGFLLKAVEQSSKWCQNGRGGPFGCVIVKDNKIVGEGCNEVTSKNDPTAHAEIVAIREACSNLKSFQLDGCVLYTSCEPCPMCLGAIYWARVTRVVYANTRKNAAEIDFADDFIYKEVSMDVEKRSIPFEHIPLEEGLKVFAGWKFAENKITY